MPVSGKTYTGKTPLEMISILPVPDFILAKDFVTLGEKLGCKSSVRFAPAHKTWKCVMSRRKPARVLFTVECTEAKWHIKACLWSIDRYRDALENCGENIKSIIRTAYDCKLCSSRCGGGAKFTFEDIEYRKCVGCCFYFSNLPESGWRDLLMLIEKEHEATSPSK